MTEQDEQRRRQIEQLLNYAGVGAQSAQAIARNLGGSAQEIEPVLRSLAEEGRIACMDDGKFAAQGSARAST
jgi:predicted ArsR family transcriptional regulator